MAGSSVNMQIDHESSLESYGERRVNQLKAQLVQMERQVILFTRSISAYKEKLHLTEGIIQQTIDFLRSPADGNSSIGNIALPRSSVLSHIRLLEDMLERLSTSQSGETPSAADMFTPNITFLKSKHTCTLAEISSGTTKHMNLSQVTKLEQRLCNLYGEVNAYMKQLRTLPSNKSSLQSSSKLLTSLERSCNDLMQLSFLVPNVPWSNSGSLPEVSADNIMKALPKLTHSKQQEVKNLLTAALKLSEYRFKLLQNKHKFLELELNNTNSEKEASMTHKKLVSQGLLREFDTYHNSIKDNMVAPLRALLDKFTHLSNSPTDENLKIFLNDFKEQSTSLGEICDIIDSHDLDDECIEQMETQMNKELQKSLKHLKKKKIDLEDEENYYRQLENEMRDEVSDRISQLSVSASASDSTPRSGKLGHGDGKKLVPIKLDNKRKIPRSKAADSFLSKYETVENQTHVDKPGKANSKRL